MPSTLQVNNQTLTSLEIPTPLGNMVAIATEANLIFLGFSNQKNTMSGVTYFNKSSITPGTNHLLEQLHRELNQYFQGTRINFSIPLTLHGTLFQKQAWQSLLTIPFGQTRSYREQAISINRPLAVRAVANANGQNPICIIVPCHRVIGSDGSLTGYGAGISRKQWLLNHERQISSKS